MQWISVNVGLPRPGIEVIICMQKDDKKVSSFGSYSAGEWLEFSGSTAAMPVTHWLYLEWPKD